jgi:hypothetical protein
MREAAAIGIAGGRKCAMGNSSTPFAPTSNERAVASSEREMARTGKVRGAKAPGKALSGAMRP